MLAFILPDVPAEISRKHQAGRASDPAKGVEATPSRGGGQNNLEPIQTDHLTRQIRWMRLDFSARLQTVDDAVDAFSLVST